MKKLLVITTACAMVLGLTAINSSALTVGDQYYIGHINDGIPSSESSEATYINSLLDLAAGAAATTCSQAATETCDRVSSTIDVSGFTDATATGAIKPAGNPVDVTGFTYLLAKYDQEQGGSYVWYVGGLTGSQSAPSNLGTCGEGPGCGLSHITLFNPGSTVPPTPTPDGGLTVGLLGLSMLGLGYLRRRLA